MFHKFFVSTLTKNSLPWWRQNRESGERTAS